MDKLDRILDKLEAQGELLARHSVLHEKNTEDLTVHVKRSDRLEEDNRLRAKEIEHRIQPIEDHIKMLRSWKVLLLGIGAMTIWVLTLIKTLGIF